MVRWSAVVLLVLLLLVGGYSFEVEQAFVYYGEKISPTNPSVGIFIFLILMFLIIFSDDLWGMIRKKKNIRLKNEF